MLTVSVGWVVPSVSVLHQVHFPWSPPIAVGLHHRHHRLHSGCSQLWNWLLWGSTRHLLARVASSMKLSMFYPCCDYFWETSSLKLTTFADLFVDPFGMDTYVAGVCRGSCFAGRSECVAFLFPRKEAAVQGPLAQRRALEAIWVFICVC